MKKKNNYLKEAGVLLIAIGIIATCITVTANTFEKNQNILFEQNPPDPSNQTRSYLSDNSVPGIVIDDFWDVQYPIHEISWWGNGFVFNSFGGILSKCESTDMIFDVVFYEDLNGEPGEVVCSYHDVTPTITDSGLVYYSQTLDDYFSLMYFEVSELSPPCMLSNGWISIQAVDGDECMFVWRISLEGNSQAYIGQRILDTDLVNYDFCFVLRTTDEPEMITLDGPVTGNYGEEQTYTIMADGYPDYDMYYYIDWGDGTIDEWIGPHPAGEEINVTHTWEVEGNYTIQVKAKNSLEMETDYLTLEVSMPKTKIFTHPFLRFLEHHPNIFPLIRQILGLKI